MKSRHDVLFYPAWRMASLIVNVAVYKVEFIFSLFSCTFVGVNLFPSQELLGVIGYFCMSKAKKICCIFLQSYSLYEWP